MPFEINRIAEDPLEVLTLVGELAATEQVPVGEMQIIDDVRGCALRESKGRSNVVRSDVLELLRPPEDGVGVSGIRLQSLVVSVTDRTRYSQHAQRAP